MKREEHYCDVCGAQLTYLDSEGDQCVSGIEVENDDRYSTPNPIHLTLRERTSSGSSSKGVSMEGREFCSVDCFEKSIRKLFDEVKEFFR